MSLRLWGIRSLLSYTLTARGIILTRTQGTVINNGIILPVINTQRLLKRPVVTESQSTGKKTKREAKSKNE